MNGPQLLVVGTALAYAGIAVALVTRRPPLRSALTYGYLAVLMMVGGYMSGIYSSPVAPDVLISPGNLKYGAVMMTAVLLLIVERDVAVVWTTVALVVAVESFKAFAALLASWALDSPEFVNVFGIDGDAVEVSLRFVAIGVLLIVIELIVMVVLFEWLKRHVDGLLTLSLAYVAVFVAVIVADGVAFPVLASGQDPGLVDAIAGGVRAKAVLAGLYGTVLLAFVLWFRRSIARYRATPLNMRDLLFSPRQRLVRRLEERERERVDLLERHHRIADDERRRLAHDLHDGPMQFLVAADFRLRTLARDGDAEHLVASTELVSETAAGLRRIMLQLSSPEVDVGSFDPTVRRVADHLLAPRGIDLELSVDLPADVSAPVVETSFQVILEALSNVAKHSGASTAKVGVVVRRGVVVGTVSDDGVGIRKDSARAPDQLGLRSMRERVELLGGRFRLAGGPDGTTLTFELPEVLGRTTGRLGV